MKSVRIMQSPDPTGTEVYTVTASLGGTDTARTFTQKDGLNVRIECDTLLIERTGTFTDVTVTPDSYAEVTLIAGAPIVSNLPDFQAEGLFLLCVIFWAWVAHRIFSPRVV